MSQEHSSHQLAAHLFRREAGKLIAVLTNSFGAQHLQLAEDVVQDTLMQACISWTQGIPAAPVAWLYRVARNKVIDALRKGAFSQHHDFNDGASIHLLQGGYDAESAGSDALISDDVLRMMYACCHPAIPPEAATALVLKTLCGFSTTEIASAFLTSEGTISKRLYRAKEVFRQQELKLDISSVAALQSRTDAVLRAIYLLFNEGYSSAGQKGLIRRELMEEAMRLCELLLRHLHTQQPPVFALMALMCFQASRSDGRLSQEGDIILLADQDRSKWDRTLIARGNHYLNSAATGESFSTYHLQAAIAAEHCNAPSFERIDWASILKYYDWLLALAPSPVTSLHRAVAVLYVRGGRAAADELLCVEGVELLGNHSLYHAVLGECYAAAGAQQQAADCYERAVQLSNVPAERALLRQKIAGLLN